MDGSRAGSRCNTCHCTPEGIECTLMACAPPGGQVCSYGGKTYRNHNTLMNGFGGMDGIKTGYTRASGYNVVTSVSRGNRKLVAVVMGGDSARSRNANMAARIERYMPGDGF